MNEDKAKMIIGSEEWFSFPELAIPAIKVRVDSGAKTSSMHAFNIQRFKRGGESWVSFEVHPLQNNRRAVIRCESPIIDRRAVKSSSGITETRYVILARLAAAAGQFWEVEVTLTNRDSMGYRMLLGREAMNGRMIVDPSLKFCLGKISTKTLNEYYGKKVQVKSGLKIAILSTNSKLYSNKRLLEAGEERGHEMEFLDTKRCYMKVDSVEAETHYRGGRVLNDIDAAITRITSGTNFYGSALTRQFESSRVLTANSSTSMTLARDKWATLQLMVQNGINTPATCLAYSPLDTSDAIEMVGGTPVIIKLLESTRGKRAAVLAETKTVAENVIKAFKALDTNILIQEYIQESKGREIQCFIIDGKVIAAMQKETLHATEVTTEIHEEDALSIVKISSEERSLAAKAVKLLGLTFARVDIIRSKNGPLLLDIHPAPSIEDVEIATGKDIAGMMISAVEKKIGWKRELSTK